MKSIYLIEILHEYTISEKSSNQNEIILARSIVVPNIHIVLIFDKIVLIAFDRS